MGNTLNPLTLAAFSDELEKMASAADVVKRLVKPTLRQLRGAGRGITGWFRGSEEAAHRAMHPVQGLREGWMSMTPVAGIRRRAGEAGFGSAQQAAEAFKADPKKLKELMDGGGAHLLQSGAAPGVGRVQATAEDLSRSGWTGAGKRTKYLPIGAKGIQTAFAAAAVPGVVHAQKSSPTGEGGALERGLGELGMTGGMVAGAGLGAVPAMALWYGGNAVGSRLGRVLDRVRSGSGLIDAVRAPSPTDAARQLETIQKYYGQGNA